MIWILFSSFDIFLNNTLIDEIKDKQASSLDTWTKVNDYEAMIDYFYNEIDHMRDDIDNIAQYIDTYYQDKVDAIWQSQSASIILWTKTGKIWGLKCHCCSILVSHLLKCSAIYR